jgi:PAS domain S-box-containing protein
MWVTDPDGYCTYLNRRWYEFTGQTPEEAQGYGWLDATHPDDKERAGEIFRASNAAREFFRVEYRLRRADGTYCWAIDVASPRFGEDGAFLGYVGSVIDIDERRRAEQTHQESEARLRTLTNALRPSSGSPRKTASCTTSTTAGTSTPVRPRRKRCRTAGLRRFIPTTCPTPQGSGRMPEREGEIRNRGSLPASRRRLSLVRRPRRAAAERDRCDHGLVRHLDRHPRPKAAEERLRELNNTLEARVAQAVAERDRIWTSATTCSPSQASTATSRQ